VCYDPPHFSFQGQAFQIAISGALFIGRSEQIDAGLISDVAVG